MKIYLNDLGIVCALGANISSVQQNMYAIQQSGVAKYSTYLGRSLALGQVNDPLCAVDNLPPQARTRNNALLLTALQQIRTTADKTIANYGPQRVAIILGTSTSGIAEGQAAMQSLQHDGHFPSDFHYAKQELNSPAQTLAHVLGIHGPAHVISTACSSSAKALASGARMLLCGLVDAAIVGGVDSLCDFTIAGFSALEAVSTEICNPLSINRKGINIGEGAALFVMTREKSAVRLSGWGETSDAYHMSAPHPQGQGAAHAMRKALAMAQLAPEQIDYINLHGTATQHNDAAEANAIVDVFGTTCPVSSTKPLTGHTLGAAGAVDAALCYLNLLDNPKGFLLPHHWDAQLDPNIPAIRVAQIGENIGRPLQHILSNSFAFGGSNASLIFSR